MVTNISSIEDLNSIRSDLTEDYVLTKDLDFNDEDSYDDFEMNQITNWTPLGNDTTKFTGTFDGGGFTIKNLFSSHSSNYMSLFGFVSGATIENLTLQDAYVNGE